MHGAASLLFLCCLFSVITVSAMADATDSGSQQSNAVHSPAADFGALAADLARAAPAADPQVLKLATQALDCAAVHGMSPSRRLAVIDYSLVSSVPRLWVFDLHSKRLLFQELVAHGRNSGEHFARAFSNKLGSLQTSLGLFRTQETYVGSNGYSLRMEGLEPGFNDLAMERAIVMHGAPYVSEKLAKSQGRVGRSWGCPAVRNGVARQMIDTLKGGQFVFSYYPDQRWLTSSTYLNCRTASTGSARAS